MVAVFDPFDMSDRFEDVGERVMEAAVRDDEDELLYMEEKLRDLHEEIEVIVPIEHGTVEPGTLQSQNAEIVAQELYGFIRFSAYFQDFAVNDPPEIDRVWQQRQYAKMEVDGVEYADADEDLDKLEKQIAARMYQGIKHAEEGDTEDGWEQIHFPPSDLDRVVRRLEDRYEHEESIYADGATEEPGNTYEEAVFRLRGIADAARTLHVVYNNSFEVPDNTGESAVRKEIIEEYETLRENIFEDEKRMLRD